MIPYTMVAHLARKSSLTSLTGHISPLHLRFLLSTLLVTFLTTIPLYSFISWSYCALWIPGLNSSGRSTHGQSVALLTQSYCSLCQPLRLPAHGPFSAQHPLFCKAPTLSAHQPTICPLLPLCSPPSILSPSLPTPLCAQCPLSAHLGEIGYGIGAMILSHFIY